MTGEIPHGALTWWAIVWKASSMQQHFCDLCDNPAVIHDTLTRAGVVKTRHLCRAHGLKAWRDALPSSYTNLGGLQQDPVFLALAEQTGYASPRRPPPGESQ